MADLHRDILPPICDWLRVNGIDPGNVPIHATPLITPAGLIVCETYAHKDGALVLDGSRPVVSVVSVPIKVQPTPYVKAWIDGGIEGLIRWQAAASEEAGA